MKFSLFIVQALMSVSFIANAGICSFLLTKNPLERITKSHKLKEITQTKQSQTGKVQLAGDILSKVDEIQSFLSSSSANDTFPFMISSKGKLVISARIIDETMNLQRGSIAAHTSLFNKLKLSSPKDFPVAAGELRKRNNQIYLISNKSGMLRGNTKSMELIEDYFSSVGVINKDVVEFRDYSRELDFLDDHVTDLQYGANAYEVHSDITTRSLMRGIEEVYRDYYLLLPLQGKPGHVDLMKLYNLTHTLDLQKVLSVIGHLNVINNEGIYYYSGKDNLQLIFNDLKYFRNILAGRKVLGRF